MKNFLFSILLLSIFPLSTLAQEETSVEDLFAPAEVKAEEIEQLDQIEKERKEGIENQLGFSLPEYIDNPSYVITFKDPSPESTGVEISIDEKDFQVIESPYTFPSLNIGDHFLRFRFNDKDNNVQILEYTVIVIPRSPIISPPVVNEDSILFSGTGLANSEILLFVSSNTFNFTDTIETDTDGKWSTEVTPEEGLAEGIYTITTISRKYGYASELSKATVFEVGEESSTTAGNTKKDDISFSFAGITTENIKDVIGNNPDLIVLISIPFVIGIFLTLLIKSLFTKKEDPVMTKKVEENIKKTPNPNGDKTLRELFEQKDDAKKEETKKEKKEEEKPKEKVVSKEEFLKEYKEIDPDDKKGKEKPSPQINKDIKVSLTSKEE